MNYSAEMAKTRQIGFRVPEMEYQKLMAVYTRAKERTLGYAPLGDVIREAIGLTPLKVITDEEKSYLSGTLAELPERENFSADAAVGLRPGGGKGRRKPAATA